MVFFINDIYIILRDENLHKLQMSSSLWKISAGMLHYLQSFIRKLELSYLPFIYMSEHAGAHVTLCNGTDITYHIFIMH